MIQRYDDESWGVSDVDFRDNGRFVKYEDHQREIGLLQGFINGLLAESEWIDAPDAECWWWMADEDGNYGAFYVFQVQSEWKTRIFGAVTSIPEGKWQRITPPTLPKQEQSQ